MTRLSRINNLYIALAIASAIAAVCSIVFYFDFLHGTRQAGSDFFFRAAALNQQSQREERIVIVGIDDKSLRELGHISSWSRSSYARVIQKTAGARVIVLDILFAEPASGDRELADSIKKAGNVILPVVQAPTYLNTSVPGQTTAGLIKPLDIFAEGAIAIGHANIKPDADGVVRKLATLIENSDRYPSIALTAVAGYLRRPQVFEAPAESGVLPFAGRSIPLINRCDMLINYIGSPGRTGTALDFQMVSFVDVLNGDSDPAIFNDRIVIIGATATGLGDVFMTPLGRESGVEIHGSAIHTILNGNFLKPAPLSAVIVSIFVFALLCGLAASRLSVRWSTLSMVFLCVIYLLIAFNIFDSGVVMDTLYPPVAVIATFMGVNLYNVTSERSEKSRIAKAFGCYISPSVAEKIIEAVRNGELKLGGDEHEVTVAFADVRGFTRISEQTGPAELVKALNTYLSVIIKSILKFDGMVNKFGGDSIMAVWNVPLEREGHALLAIKAMISAEHDIKELQRKRPELPRMEFGIGINTGKALVGNLGSEDRLEYSVIGDAVNVAARLASSAPGGKLWVGDDTFKQAKDISVKQLEPLTLRGKNEPVKACEVVAVNNWQPEWQDRCNKS